VAFCTQGLDLCFAIAGDKLGQSWYGPWTLDEQDYAGMWTNLSQCGRLAGMAYYAVDDNNFGELRYQRFGPNAAPTP
jgi:hypothetical protein